MADNEARIPIRRALISVYDKAQVAELARVLAEHGIEIVSTGSTARVIADAGVDVIPVEQVTGFPECFDGRVKTLHPLVHGGILADRTKDSHVAQMTDLGVLAIDLVVVNLYPFEATVASGATREECVEQIDIGGPAMVRAAAKNHASVAVVTSPDAYGEVADAVAAGGFTLEERAKLAATAFAHTAAYDVAVARWMARPEGGEAGGFEGGAWKLASPLRYGENPHQRAALYVDAAEVDQTGIAHATQLGGKEMSYNNYQDVDAAWRAAYDHAQPAVAIIKHANPCGIAIGSTVAEAHRRAHACDPVSAYGGVIAVNREVDRELAVQVAPIFTEVIAAPSFTEDALTTLRSKKNLRILQVTPGTDRHDVRHISGGVLIQERDVLDAPGDTADGWSHVAGPAADSDTMADLEFAWRAVRSVRSNAILIASGGASVGVGMGQVNRVDSCRLAVERANTLGESGPRTRGAVAASDAFFPFADGFQVLADAGVRAVVQPGGSIRDDEVIAAAQEAGVSLYFTGARHFSH